MRKTIFVLLLILISTTLLFARPTKGVAIGAQASLMTTGLVADFPLGPISLGVGLGTSLIVNYIVEISEELFEEVFPPYLIISGNLTYPIALGEHFDLKVGLATMMSTDFQTGVMGTAGAAVKGEYWIPNSKFAIFAHLDIPLFAYSAHKDLGFTTLFDWSIPLLGLFTSSIGFLWAF